MGLLQTVYSVLLVSASRQLNESLTALLPGRSYFPVHCVNNINSAKRMLAEKDYDFIIINSPLPDENGIEFAIDAGISDKTVVLLLIQKELSDEIYERTAACGVFTLPKPFSKQIFQVALSWLAVVRERSRSNEKKELTLEEKMNEIRLVNKAKWVLIRELKMDEQQAHRYIEKQAMDRCISKREVAEILIKTYS